MFLLSHFFMDEFHSNRKQIGVHLLAVLILGGAFIVGQYIGALHLTKPTITVQGQAKMSAAPDIAVLNFGVQTGRQKSAQGAMEILSNKMNAVMEAVTGLGIEEKDITTQNLWLNPSYDYYDGRRVETGYEANQNLSVKVRDLSKLTTALDTVVSEGVNQVGGVSFTIDDPDALREEGRVEAIADAQQKAKKLAVALGKSLGKFKGYGEGFGGGQPMPYMSMEIMDSKSIGMGGGGGPPVPTGEQEITVSVSLTYELR